MGVCTRAKQVCLSTSRVLKRVHRLTLQLLEQGTFLDRNVAISNVECLSQKGSAFEALGGTLLLKLLRA